MQKLMILLATVVAGHVVLLPPLARSPLWRATATPLASIIGSGFLVLGPILNAAMADMRHWPWRCRAYVPIFSALGSGSTSAIWAMTRRRHAPGSLSRWKERRQGRMALADGFSALAALGVVIAVFGAAVEGS
ncbi:hypothetical protein P775_18550 [Puniceibacterium antarcticum]|uniref:Uncharacterized protein n=1 Tax=Puniceibacterium antarcticum TaxID=1206336 RepID=A0A2G8RAI6_9RHOB|nr:hypothetical protein [Puniceibacterium antarcticum]PIL18575.1 hypothetical protein P775_18550 [Puniceibacterium antarcticum]